MSTALLAVLLLGLSAPVSAGVSQTKQTAWICFAVFIVLFVAASVYVRQRRTRAAQRPRGSGDAAPVTVSAWGKAAPPKDNGKAGYGQTVAGGAWERDA